MATQAQSVIDLALGTIPNLKTTPILYGISDHTLIELVIDYKDHIFQPSPPDNKLYIPQENWDTFTRTVHHQVLTQETKLRSEKSVEHMVATIHAIITNAAHLAASEPTKQRRKPNCWFDPRITPLIKDKHNAHKKYSLSRLSLLWGLLSPAGKVGMPGGLLIQKIFGLDTTLLLDCLSC